MTASDKYDFEVKAPAASPWDGSPLTLQVDDWTSIPQTPNGSTVLAWQNKSEKNNAGSLIYTSGGSQPQELDAPPRENQPRILAKNWEANNFKLTNQSLQKDTPIWIEMFGPGIPGAPTPVALPYNQSTALASGKTATAQAQPNFMQLRMTSNTANLTIIALIGGPSDPKTGINAYLFAVNWPEGTPVPDYYTKAVTQNATSFTFNWGGASMFLANMSPNNSADVQLVLRSL